MLSRVSFPLGLHLAGLLALLALPAYTAPLSSNATTAQVLKLEQVWMRAAQSRDIRALSRILSDDYLDINYRGMVRDKADALHAPNLRIKAYTQKLNQERVRVYGNTAIVTGRGLLTTSKRHYAWRFTDVFVRRDGRWRAVSSQETPEIH